MEQASSIRRFATLRRFFAYLVTSFLLMNTGLAIGMAIGIAIWSDYNRGMQGILESTIRIAIRTDFDGGINETPTKALIFFASPAIGLLMSLPICARRWYFNFALTIGIIGSIVLLAGLCFVLARAGDGMGVGLTFLALVASVAIHGITAIGFAIIMAIGRLCRMYYRCRFAKGTQETIELR